MKEPDPHLCDLKLEFIHTLKFSNLTNLTTINPIRGRYGI